MRPIPPRPDAPAAARERDEPDGEFSRFFGGGSRKQPRAHDADGSRIAGEAAQSTPTAVTPPDADDPGSRVSDERRFDDIPQPDPIFAVPRTTAPPGPRRVMSSLPPAPGNVRHLDPLPPRSTDPGPPRRVFRSAPPRELPPLTPAPSSSVPASGWTPLVPDRREGAAEPIDPRSFTPLAPTRAAGPPVADVPPLPEPLLALVGGPDLDSAFPLPAPRASEPDVVRVPASRADHVAGAADASAEPGVATALGAVIDRALSFTAAAVRARPPASTGRWLRSAVPHSDEPPNREPAEVRQDPPANAGDRAPESAPDALAERSAAPSEPVPDRSGGVPPTPTVAGPPGEVRAEFREAARPVIPPPAPDELLPPPSMRESVRIQVDSELQLDVSTRGHRVDVTLHGPREVVDPLRTLGPELDASLVASGFALGQFSAQGEAGHEAPAEQETPSEPAPEAAPPARTPTPRRGPWRVNRYA